MCASEMTTWDSLAVVGGGGLFWQQNYCAVFFFLLLSGSDLRYNIGSMEALSYSTVQKPICSSAPHFICIINK